MPKKAIILTPELLHRYARQLREQERAPQTIQKYVHDLTALMDFLDGKPLTKAALLEWKEVLIAAHAPSSVNTKLAAVNGLLSHLDRRELRLRPLRAGVSTPGRLAGWDWWSHNLGSVVCTAETGRLAVCITFYFFCNGCTITLTDNVTVKAKYAAVYGVGYTTIEVFNSAVEGEYAIYGAGPTNKVTLRGAKVTGSKFGIYQGPYPDSADISDWAQNAFAWALSTGVIDGRDGKLAAGESVTRAEAATILARFHMLSK